MLAPTAAFLREGRFAFQKTLAETAEEKANPWLLLERDADDGAIPVIADASALEYVLHRSAGRDASRSATRVCACASWARCGRGCSRASW